MSVPSSLCLPVNHISAYILMSLCSSLCLSVHSHNSPFTLMSFHPPLCPSLHLSVQFYVSPSTLMPFRLACVTFTGSQQHRIDRVDYTTESRSQMSHQMQRHNIFPFYFPQRKDINKIKYYSRLCNS
jgi:hypothetical protein